MKEVLASLLKSKKFIALLIGLLVSLLSRWLDPALAESVAKEAVVLVSAFLVGQGIADHGKEKARIEDALAQKRLKGE